MPRAFTSLLIVALISIVQPSSGHHVPDLIAKRHAGTPTGKALYALLQPRQTTSPPPFVPPQCQQYCSPVNAVLIQGCPVAQCCDNGFQAAFAVCFICAANGSGNTDYGPTQTTLNQMKAACDAQGLPVNQIWLPGQGPPASTTKAAAPPKTTSQPPPTQAAPPPAATATPAAAPPPAQSPASTQQPNTTPTVRAGAPASSSSGTGAAPAFNSANPTNAPGDPTPQDAGSVSDPGQSDPAPNTSGAAVGGVSFILGLYMAFWGLSVNTFYFL